MRWLGLTSLLCVLSACDVTTVREEPSAVARNQCQNADQCAGGACINNECRSLTAAFKTLLFEVTPPADGSPIAGVQFLKTVTDLSATGAALDLGFVAQIAGRVRADKEVTCGPAFVGKTPDAALATSGDASVPAVVSLIPVSSVLGLSTPRAIASSELLASTYYGFSMNVPTGTYDIYVEPGRQVDQHCPLPPRFLRGNVIPQGGTLPLLISLPAPSWFEFHVNWPLADDALSGWTVDMLDPTSGRVISTRVPLALSPSSRTDYVATVPYNPVAIVDSAAIVDGAIPQLKDEMIRLSPPEGLAAPTILLLRSALSLFSAGKGTLQGFEALPAPVHVRAQVTAQNMPTPAAATVQLVARKITGMPDGIFASFVRTVPVGQKGLVDAYLLPGEYDVAALPDAQLSSDSAPKETSLAAVTGEWTVPSTPSEQAGKVIALIAAPTVVGTAVDAKGDGVATAQVQAVASPLFVQSDALQGSLGAFTFVPRASSTTVQGGGSFSLSVDPGTFDIAVRPNSETGFAWLVAPAVRVPAGGIGLNRITMPLPVAYSGTVQVTGVNAPRAVPGALVRAYLYMKSGEYTADEKSADSVLQVAETRAKDDGTFTVLIPAELHRFAQ